LGAMPTTTFTKAAVTNTWASANSATNTIVLDDVSSFSVGDTVKSSGTADVSGIVGSTDYKIKSIDVATKAITLVPGATADGDVGTTTEVGLTYQAESGSLGTTANTYFLSGGVGTSGSALTTLSHTVEVVQLSNNTDPVPSFGGRVSNLMVFDADISNDGATYDVDASESLYTDHLLVSWNGSFMNNSIDVLSRTTVPVYNVTDTTINGTFLTLKARVSMNNEELVDAMKTKMAEEYEHPGQASVDVVLNGETVGTFARVDTAGMFSNVAEERLKNPVKDLIIPHMVDEDAVFKALYNKTCAGVSNETKRNLCNLKPTDVSVWNSQDEECAKNSRERTADCSGGVRLEVLAPNEWLAANLNESLQEWSEDPALMMADIDLYSKDMHIDQSNLTVQPKESLGMFFV
jgi:hypothetical protein